MIPVRLTCLAAVAVVAASSQPARAQWLLNFSTAETLGPGQIGFIAGTGGQVTSAGAPAKTSYTPFLAHAGIRIGLADRLDIGYRLVTVPLPYSSVGPSLGSAIDAKVRLTPSGATWHVAVIAGGGISYLKISNQDRTAWSPGGALTLSHAMAAGWTFVANGRYSYTEIPSAAGGSTENHVHAIGGSVASRITATSSVSVVPEIGVFALRGAVSGRTTDGVGLQYGVVLSARLH